jgi:hypothetical protein
VSAPREVRDCPRCREVNDVSRLWCARCRAPLADVPTRAVPEGAASDSAPAPVCPRCSVPMEGGTAYLGDTFFGFLLVGGFSLNTLFFRSENGGGRRKVLGAVKQRDAFQCRLCKGVWIG